jgi:hypothetical protein
VADDLPVRAAGTGVLLRDDHSVGHFLFLSLLADKTSLPQT